MIGYYMVGYQHKSIQKNFLELQLSYLKYMSALICNLTHYDILCIYENIDMDFNITN